MFLHIKIGEGLMIFNICLLNVKLAAFFFNTAVKIAHLIKKEVWVEFYMETGQYIDNFGKIRFYACQRLKTYRMALNTCK